MGKNKKKGNGHGSNRPKAILNANQAIKILEEEGQRRKQAREEQEQNLSHVRDYDSPVKGDRAIFTTEIKGELVTFEGLIRDFSASATNGDFLVDVDIVEVLVGKVSLASFTVFWSERTFETQNP